MSNHTITFKVNVDPAYFDFWSGAKDRMQDATEKQREMVYQRLEVFSSQYELSECDINDIVWFDCDDIFYPEEE